MGYVKCAGYVWDMCGVRYANNLLKNPATKRLSGKIQPPRLVAARTFGGAALAACMQADLGIGESWAPLEWRIIFYFEEALCLNHALIYI